MYLMPFLTFACCRIFCSTGDATLYTMKNTADTPIATTLLKISSATKINNDMGIYMRWNYNFNSSSLSFSAISSI
jgi:hypothetical protein